MVARLQDAKFYVSSKSLNIKQFKLSDRRRVHGPGQIAKIPQFLWEDPLPPKFVLEKLTIVFDIKEVDEKPSLDIRVTGCGTAFENFVNDVEAQVLEKIQKASNTDDLELKTDHVYSAI